MRSMNNREVTTRIRTFLDKKFTEFPELGKDSDLKATTNDSLFTTSWWPFQDRNTRRHNHGTA